MNSSNIPLKQWVSLYYPTIKPEMPVTRQQYEVRWNTHALGIPHFDITRVDHNNILCIILILSLLFGMSMEGTNIMRIQYTTNGNGTPTHGLNWSDAFDQLLRAEPLRVERILSIWANAPSLRRNRSFLWHSLQHRLTLSVTLQPATPRHEYKIERGDRPADHKTNIPTPAWKCQLWALFVNRLWLSLPFPIALSLSLPLVQHCLDVLLHSFISELPLDKLSFSCKGIVSGASSLYSPGGGI